jgi:hypothetical protein
MSTTIAGVKDPLSRREFLGAAVAAGAGAALPAPSSQAKDPPGPALSFGPGSSSGPTDKAPAVHVPARSVPVLTECDVLVCGAGPAGVTAAIAAARHKLNVVLVERWCFAGGMGTAAMVNIWHTSDRQKRVIFGIIGEVIDRGVKAGLCKQYAHFPKQHETHEYQVEGLKFILDQMLAEAGVRTYFSLPAGHVLVEGDAIQAVLCETKTGAKAIRAKMFIDATGDGDVAARAGVPFDFGRHSDGKVQGMTLMYRLTDIDPRNASKIDQAAIVKLMEQERDAGRLPPFGALSLGYYVTGGHPNMNPAAGNPLDEADLTRCLMQTRRQMYAYVDFWRKHAPGFENAKVVASGACLGVRESRRFRCLKRLTAEDVLNTRKHDDAVGHGFWMIDIHDPKGSGYTTWLEGKYLPAGKSYHIPYGMMVPEKVSNLLIAGRCASSTHEAHASVRLMSHCGVMGQGAGTAAALALESGKTPAAVDMPALRRTLQADGVYIRDE